MKALVYQGPACLTYEDLPEVHAASGELVVAVHAVGICGSDLHGYSGESGRRQPPLIMGHEAVGQVITVGLGVAPDWVGRNVVVQPILSCGECDQCRSGLMNRCRKRRFLGANTNGAMCQRLAVPVSNALPIPQSTELNHATLTEPLAVALHAARRAGPLQGKKVLVAGSGPIGLFVLIVARQLGADSVVTTDVVESRLWTSRRLGAAAALNPAKEGWRAELSDFMEGAEFDVTFDAVGIQSTFNQAVELVRPGGTVIALGGWRSVNLELPPFVAREIEMHGSFNFVGEDFADALHWIAERRFDPSLLITETYPLDQGAHVFDQLVTDRSGAMKVLLIPPD